jgi:hypothetical protein
MTLKASISVEPGSYTVAADGTLKPRAVFSGSPNEASGAPDLAEEARAAYPK